MITNVSLQTVWVTDVDAAKDFYVNTLGFAEGDDVTMGDFRWCTVHHPGQPDLELALMVPGPPLDDEDAEFVRRALAKGSMSGVACASTTAGRRTTSSRRRASTSCRSPRTGRTASKR